MSDKDVQAVIDSLESTIAALTAERDAANEALGSAYSQGHADGVASLTEERDDYRDGAAAEADMVDELRTALAQERTAREAAESARWRWQAASMDVGKSDWTKAQWRQLAALTRHRAEAAEALVGEVTSLVAVIRGSIPDTAYQRWNNWLARAAALTAERSGTPVKDGQN